MLREKGRERERERAGDKAGSGESNLYCLDFSAPLENYAYRNGI